MKKIFLITIVLYLPCISCDFFSFSQNSLSVNNDSIAKCQYKKFQIGMLFSPQFTSLENKDDRNAGKELDYVPTLNFAYGLLVQKNIYKSVGLMAGLAISNEGQKYKGNIEYWVPSDIIGDTTEFYFNDNYTAIVKLRYTQLPVMIYWSPHISKSFYLFTSVGIKFNFLEKASVFINGITMPTSNNNPDARSYYEKFGMSAIWMFGTEIYNKNKITFNGCLTFAYGLFDVENKNIFKRDPGWRFPIGSIVHPQYYNNPNYYPDAPYTIRPLTSNIVFGISFVVAYNFLRKNNSNSKP